MKKSAGQSKREDLAHRRRKAQDRPDPLEQGDQVWFHGVPGTVTLVSVNGSVKVRGPEGQEFHATRASMLHREGPAAEEVPLFHGIMDRFEGLLHHVAAEAPGSLPTLKVRLSWDEGKARLRASKIEDRLSA